MPRNIRLLGLENSLGTWTAPLVPRKRTTGWRNCCYKKFWKTWDAFAKKNLWNHWNDKISLNHVNHYSNYQRHVDDLAGFVATITCQARKNKPIPLKCKLCESKHVAHFNKLNRPNPLQHKLCNTRKLTWNPKINGAFPLPRGHSQGAISKFRDCTSFIANDSADQCHSTQMMSMWVAWISNSWNQGIIKVLYF